MIAVAQPADRAARAAPRALPGTDSSISPKTLPLFLTATVVGRTVSEGYAMIGVSLENPQTYIGGAIIENGARLREIHSKYVVLERNGRTARLYLNGTAEAGAQKQLTDELTHVGGAAPVPQAAATSYELFTDYVRPNPVYDGTTLRGYEVYPGARSGPFQRMGLQPGDLIVSVDGQPMVDEEQATETFRALAEGSALTASVVRKGRTESLALDGMLIVADQESRQREQGTAMAAAAVVGR
jgi:type II secretion system protein C